MSDKPNQFAIGTRLQLHNLAAAEGLHGPNFLIADTIKDVPLLEESSVRFFERVVNDPVSRRPSDFCFLGKILFRLEKREGALELLRSAQELFPDSWEISYYLGGFNLEQGRVKDSYEYAKKTVELGAWRPAAWEQMDEICRALGQTADATQCERRGSFVKAEKVKLAATLIPTTGSDNPARQDA